VDQFFLEVSEGLGGEELAATLVGLVRFYHLNALLAVAFNRNQ
jgi:hypothetical protein